MNVRARRCQVTAAASCAGIAVLAGHILVGSATASPVSSAARPNISSKGGADVYECTSTQGRTNLGVDTGFSCLKQLFHVGQRQALTMVCWRDDRLAQERGNNKGDTGDGHDRWFYVYLDDGREGYVWADQVASPTPRTPSCSKVNWMNAADWAIGHIGQKRDSDDTYGSWSGIWSGSCVIFGHMAWGRQTHEVGANGTAYNQWQWYVAQHQADEGRTRPPRGALVFFAPAPGNDAGHVAVSIGNWRMIGTVGLAGEKPVALGSIIDYDRKTGGTYLGWTMPVNPPADAEYNRNALAPLPKPSGGSGPTAGGSGSAPTTPPAPPATPPPPTDSPQPHPTPPVNYEGRIIRLGDEDYFVSGGKKLHIDNGMIEKCILGRGHPDPPVSVSDAVANSYPTGLSAHCLYEQEPGVNFVREVGDLTVWLVHADGTKQHVGTTCAGSAKKYQVFEVPPGETAGHRQTTDWFASDANCAALPG